MKNKGNALLFLSALLTLPVGLQAEDDKAKVLEALGASCTTVCSRPIQPPSNPQPIVIDEPAASVIDEPDEEEVPNFSNPSDPAAGESQGNQTELQPALGFEDNNPWVGAPAGDLDQAESKITGLLKAAKEGALELPKKASAVLSNTLFKVWFAQKKGISQALVRQIPDAYRADEDIYKKPLPVVKTYNMLTNGAVSEMLVATLCDEMRDSGVRSVEMMNRCQSVVYDKAQLKF